MKAIIERCPNCKKVSSRQILRPKMVNNYQEEVTYKMCPKCESKMSPAARNLLKAIFREGNGVDPTSEQDEIQDSY